MCNLIIEAWNISKHPRLNEGEKKKADDLNQTGNLAISQHSFN